jgi:hypothetical protein
MNHHDRSNKKNKFSPTPNPKEVYGSWVEHAYAGSFPNRETALFLIGGPGTGKTTLARPVKLLYPNFLVGGVSTDSFPFGLLIFFYAFDMFDV